MASVAVEPLTYNVPQAAQALGVHPMTIRNLVKRGELPAVRVGDRVLIAREALRAFVGSKG